LVAIVNALLFHKMMHQLDYPTYTLQTPGINQYTILSENVVVLHLYTA